LYACADLETRKLFLDHFFGKYNSTYNISLNSSDFKHEDNQWFYRKLPTCVGSGNSEEKCDSKEFFCAGENQQASYGDELKQATALYYATLEKMKEHPYCPSKYESI